MTMRQAINQAETILDNLVLYPVTHELKKDSEDYKTDVAYLADTLIDLDPDTKEEE